VLHGLPIGGLSPIRTRDWTAATRGCGIHCDRDVIRRTWLVHLGSAPFIRYGRGEGRRAHLSPRKDTAARGRASTRLLDGISAPARRSISRRGENTQFHPKSAERSAETGCKYRAPVRSAAAALLRRQKVGKQIARLASRKMTHIVWDRKGYRRKTR